MKELLTRYQKLKRDGAGLPLYEAARKETVNETAYNLSIYDELADTLLPRLLAAQEIEGVDDMSELKVDLDVLLPLVDNALLMCGEGEESTIKLAGTIKVSYLLSQTVLSNR